MKTAMLGKSEVEVPAMGVGTMMWAGMPGAIKNEQDAMDTFRTCLDNGMNFFDTAELYGNGASELLLGKCIRADERPVLIADKFAPVSKIIPNTPKRRTAKKNSPEALLEALDDSLMRLGVDVIDLYQLHAPPKDGRIEDYMDVMAEAVNAGKIRAVGVCNFSAAEIDRAQTALARHHLPLATAMVGYNILNRRAETDGVMKICAEKGISLIPFAPLAEGILTGKYRNGQKIPMSYAATLYFSHLGLTDIANRNKSLWSRITSKPQELDKEKMELVFSAMEEVANPRGRSLAQVALNWLLTNEEVTVIPIPGMKNTRQAESNLGALGWEMSRAEREKINQAEEAMRWK